MEHPPLSRRPDIASKRRCNGGSAASSKAVYDDVFGGPPKFGAPALSPRVEDYSEIFGGFRTPRATSIPVLDLPMVDDDADEVFFDVRSSGFDYAEVFGGFGGRDFAVSFEDLVMGQSNGLDDSSDEAWTPEADYLSEESDHSIQDKRFSNEDSCESIDGCTEFNISYNKSREKLNEDLSIGIRHTTQLHDVSGYTFMVDKVASLPNSDYLYSRDYNDHHNISYSGEIAGTRHLKKVISQPAKGRNAVPSMDFVRNGSTFLTISDVSLKTRPSDLPPPSRPPPSLNVEKGYSDKTASSCRSVSEGSGSDNSPPYFDVEVDASSSAAAMKNSMGYAQEKLKKVKESVERNSDCFHSRKISDSKNDRRDNKEKAAKLVDGSRSIKGAGMGLGSIQGGEDHGIEFSDMKEKHKLRKTSQINSDSLEGNYHLNMEKSHAEENEGSESLSSQGSDYIDVAGEWKEATQFFELVTNKSKKIVDQDSNKTALERCYEHQKKETAATSEGLQGHPEMMSFMPNRAFESEISYERSGVENRLKVLDKRVQIIEKACRGEPNQKKFSIELQPEETEKRRVRAYDLQGHSDSVKVIEKASRQNVKHVDKGSQWIEDNRSMGNAKKFPYGKEDSNKRSGNALELEENEKKLNVAENEMRLKKVARQDEKEKMEKDVFEQEENGKTLRESVELKESERKQKEALEKKENERRLKEIHENEERLKREKEATEQKENERRLKEIRENEERLKREKEATERKENDRRLKEIRENEERLKREKEAAEREENEKRQKEIIEREENEKRLKLALEKEEMQRRQREASELEKAKRVENEMRLKALEKEENKSRQAAVDQQKNEKKQEEAFATKQCEKKQLEGSDVACKEANAREEIAETVKEACESDPVQRMEEVCQKPTCRYLEEAEEIETELEADEKPEKVGSISEAKCGKKESKTEHGDAIDKERKIDLKMGEDYIELNQVSGFNNNDIKKTTTTTGTHDNGSELEATKEIDANETSKLSTDLRNGEAAGASGIEQKSNDKIKRYFQVNMDTEHQGVKIPHEGVDLMPKCAVKLSVEAGENAKAAQPAMDARGNNQRATQRAHTSQSTEQKGKKDTLQKEDKESERMKRERELELERLRKMEEEREREREREKDRMAVDPTILETRERAYGEVRQRTLNDARERLEKVCMEAREKSFPDNKASVESRIRAERAAVERATAEARERAFQKAMAESQQSQNGSKYQYSSVYSEKYGVEGESPQRCKARLERYRRTAERAANALQELNMRDLHAQREQAERNRLAETLDADVKRWSSGKEGNLRALLSTLQYILGPDSGWQPIHLTEVITAAAVKKAYRKATLCVHPDKLQQRGASIQQKYICEKVFDLLKEAWNRFNSEER